MRCGTIGTKIKTRVCHDKNYCFQKTSELKGFCADDPKTRIEETCPGDICVGMFCVITLMYIIFLKVYINHKYERNKQSILLEINLIVVIL